MISEVGVLISQLWESFLEACFCHLIQVLMHSICNIFGIDLISNQSIWNIKSNLTNIKDMELWLSSVRKLDFL